jgi:hypothetical protein
MREDGVYLATKRFLKANGWLMLAGQPPNGCDHLPVVEIKAPNRTEKGSKGTYKPDLIAYRKGVLLLVECKPVHDEGDAQKLRGILMDSSRCQELITELVQRNILNRHQIKVAIDELQSGIRGALAHAGSVLPMVDLVVISLDDRTGCGRFYPPTRGDELLEIACEAPD